MRQTERPEALCAVLLAGGQGLRMRPTSLAIPKPLLPFGTKVIVEILIEQISALAPDRIVVSLGHLPDHVRGYLDYRRVHPAPDFVVDTTLLGTAGPLALIRPVPELLLIANGDVLTDLDFADFVARHRASGAAMTVMAIRHETTLPFGRLTVDEADTLAEWSEKPLLSHLVSGGIYCLDGAAIGMIPPGREFDMPHLVEALLAAGKTVRVHRHTGQWFDLGSIDNYEDAARAFAADPEGFLPVPVAARV